MCTSWVIQSAAASFEDGASARLATSANSTRSTSVVTGAHPAPSATRYRRPGPPQPVQQPRRPRRARRDQPQPISGPVRAGRSGRVRPAAVGLAEVAVDRADQPAQPVRVEPVFPAQVEQHVRLRRGTDPMVVGQSQVAHDRAVLVAPLGRQQVHDRTRSHLVLLTQASTHRNVCPHFWALPHGCGALTSSNIDRIAPVCPSTAERGGNAERTSTTSTPHPPEPRYRKPGTGCGREHTDQPSTETWTS